MLILTGCSSGKVARTDVLENTKAPNNTEALSPTPELLNTDTPNATTNRPLIIAHRGARSLAPENTLAAAQIAYDLGADMWEMDVAVTSDNELVVLHDDTLDRTCNVKDIFPDRKPWQVWEFTLAEVQSLDCGSWFINTDPFGQIKAGAVSQTEMDSYVGEPMPTLREVLVFTRDNHWRINVELKDQLMERFDPVIVEKTVSLVTELGMDDGEQVVISSFNHDYLKRIHELNPNIPIQALTSVKIKNLSDYLTNLGTNTCNPKLDVWSKKELKELALQGIQLNVWTVNDEATIKELIEAKVQGIFTDYPQKMISILNN